MQGTDLVQAAALGRGRHDHAHVRTHQAAHAVQIALELLGIQRSALAEYTTGWHPSPAPTPARSHVVEQHLTGTERLDD